jgi:ATP-binding cassette subfamily B protein
MFKRLRPLFPYLKKYRRGYVLGTLSVFMDNGAWILFPLVIGRAFDDLRTGITRQKLVQWALALIAITVVKGIFRFLTRWIVIGI